MRHAAFALAALLAASAASGQKPRQPAPAPAEPPVLNWEVTLGGAGGFGSSSTGIEGAFRAAGYAEGLKSSGDFLSTTFFPSFRVRIGERFAVGVSGASTKIGSTTAAAAPAPVSIQRSAADVAAVFFWRPIAGVRLGAGPAWYRLRAESSGGDGLTASRLGWLAEAGLAFPEGGRWYADLGVQYRGTGRADLGTYTPPAGAGHAPVPIPLDGIGFEHWAFVAGIGFRF